MTGNLGPRADMEGFARQLASRIELLGPDGQYLSLARWQALVNHPLMEGVERVINLDLIAREAELHAVSEAQHDASLAALIEGQEPLACAAIYTRSTTDDPSHPLVRAYDATTMRRFHSYLGTPQWHGQDVSTDVAFWTPTSVIAGRIGFSVSEDGREYATGHHAAWTNNPLLCIWTRSPLFEQPLFFVSSSGAGSCRCEEHHGVAEFASDTLNPLVAELHAYAVHRQWLFTSRQ